MLFLLRAKGRVFLVGSWAKGAEYRFHSIPVLVFNRPQIIVHSTFLQLQCGQGSCSSGRFPFSILREAQLVHDLCFVGLPAVSSIVYVGLLQI